MANEALFVQGGSYDAAELRRLIAGFFTAASPGGIIDGLTVTAGVGASVSISSGYAFVLDGAGGAYMGTKTNTTSLALTGWSGVNRTDRIYARIMDPGSGATAGEMEINKAQGSTSIPALSIPLADVTVTSSGVTVSTAPRVQADVNGAATRYATIAAVNTLSTTTNTRLTALENKPSGLYGSIFLRCMYGYGATDLAALPVSQGSPTPANFCFEQPTGLNLSLVSWNTKIRVTGSSVTAGRQLLLVGVPKPFERTNVGFGIIQAGWGFSQLGSTGQVAGPLVGLDYVGEDPATGLGVAAVVFNVTTSSPAPDGGYTSYYLGLGTVLDFWINTTYVARRETFTRPVS